MAAPKDSTEFSKQDWDEDMDLPKQLVGAIIISQASEFEKTPAETVSRLPDVLITLCKGRNTVKQYENLDFSWKITKSNVEAAVKRLQALERVAEESSLPKAT